MVSTCLAGLERVAVTLVAVGFCTGISAESGSRSAPSLGVSACTSLPPAVLAEVALGILRHIHVFFREYLLQC